MSWSFHKKLKIVAIVFATSVLTVAITAHAGSLTPSSAPAANGYTLQDIFNRLSTNVTAVSGVHDFSPTTTPQSTFPTLSEIYGAIPTIDVAKIFSGTTYLGKVGTLTLACATSTFDGISNLVPDTYDGAGNGSNRWCMKDTGTAVSENIISGLKAWVNGIEITGSYITTNLIPSNVKSGVTFATSSTGTLLQALGTAGAGDVLASKTFSSSTASNVSGTIPVKTSDNAVVTTATSTNKLLLTPPTGYYDGVATVSTTSTAFTATNIRTGINLFGIQGTMSTGYTYGDNSAEKVLTTATGVGTYNATNLIPSNVKSGVTFATSSTGTYTAAAASGYPGTGWVANGSGNGSTALTKAACDAAGTTTWAWFEDANGNGTTNDPEDGQCVKTTTVNSVGSWNGAAAVTPNSLTTSASAGGTANTISSTTANWTIDMYKNHSIKITSGTANPCWGIIKTNTATTATLYGSWLTAAHVSGCGIPDGTSVFSIYNENNSDNTFIGDYTCTGNFPTGAVVAGLYPTSSSSALALADCYDGKRDLLPAETDRAVVSGTITSLATTSTSTTISDSNLTTNPITANDFVGQKVLITSATGTNSYGFIESNTTGSFTVSGWSSTAPDVGSAYKVIYIIPFAGSNTGGEDKKYKGPLTIEVLKAWKGTRLPTAMDFYGFCGAKAGDAYNTAPSGASYRDSGASANTALGNYGVNIGRGKNAAPNDKYMYLSNSGSWEWLSEQNNSNSARVAGGSACANVSNNVVSIGSNRFRAVFRP